MKQNTDRISIQVGLGGYSFQIETLDGTRSSEWMSADRVFSTPELQRQYDKVEIAVFTPKFTLVPKQFYDKDSAAEMLSEVSEADPRDVTDVVDVPGQPSVLLFSDVETGTLAKVISETVRLSDGTKPRPLPEIYYMLKSLPSLGEYNKILASYMDGILYLVVAQGDTLMLCNSFKAQDFTTAEYFIFLVMKRLQLNPEMSTITFRTPLDVEQEMSLYRYFHNVNHIRNENNRR